MSPAAPKPSGAPRSAAPWPLDPAWVAILGAMAVLLLAIFWLTRQPTDAPAVGATANRIAELERRVQELSARPAPPDLGGVERRIAALEGRPAPAAPDLSPIQQRFAALEPQVAQAAQAARAAAEQAQGRAAALEPRIAEAAAAARLAAEQAQRAQSALDQRIAEARAAFEQVNQRVAGLEPRVAQAAEAAQRAGAAGEQAARQAQAALEQRAAEARQAFEQANARIAEAAQAARAAGEAAQRNAQALEQAGQRAAALEQQLGQRAAAVEQRTDQRVAALERQVQELTAAAARAERALVARAMNLAVAGGQPLGDLVQRLGATPPAALARFQQNPPPTPASLRASFEEAARSARGPGTDELLPRLQGAFTVRRGNETLFGEQADASLDAARQALAQGNVEEALAQVNRLPAPAREAMRGWIEQAEALVAARAALRNLQAG